MNKALAEMFHYNAWANRELFEACRSLADEHLDCHISASSWCTPWSTAWNIERN